MLQLPNYPKPITSIKVGMGKRAVTYASAQNQYHHSVAALIGKTHATQPVKVVFAHAHTLRFVSAETSMIFATNHASIR
ncbi:hypothetical protein O6P43_008332 [Quillaja saponaria]|uniref:Uncharacterized protein n=1 Tax=Quillaja saponaria TaxID=32244 RepID=A0AAD7M507_QUISA|nr:hypothetical protein O6P43_008332 [Quillaja saponaria]